MPVNEAIGAEGLSLQGAALIATDATISVALEIAKVAVFGGFNRLDASLALAGDLVVAAESAYFMLAFVGIGLVPDGGASLFVPSRVGFARAAEMAMLGEPIYRPEDAEE